VSALSYYLLPNANIGVANPVTSKQQVYARYSWKDVLANIGGSGLVANQFLPNVLAHDQNRSLLVSDSYSITPTLLNEFRIGFTDFQENDTFPIQGSTAISQLGLQGIDISQHPNASAFPTFAFSDGEFSQIGQDRTGTTILADHSDHRQRQQGAAQEHAAVRRGYPQGALQRADVLPTDGRLRRLHFQPGPVY